MAVAVRAPRAALAAFWLGAVLAALPSRCLADVPADPVDTLLVELATTLVDSQKPSIAPLLAPSRVRIHLRLPAGKDIGDEQQRYGSQQAAVLLREYLDAVELRPFDPEAGPQSEPVVDRRVWLERAAPDSSARSRPHGILHVSVRADAEGPFEHQRWFVGLRETASGWKVEEILHLP